MHSCQGGNGRAASQIPRLTRAGEERRDPSFQRRRESRGRAGSWVVGPPPTTEPGAPTLSLSKGERPPTPPPARPPPTWPSRQRPPATAATCHPPLPPQPSTPYPQPMNTHSGLTQPPRRRGRSQAHVAVAPATRAKPCRSYRGGSRPKTINLFPLFRFRIPQKHTDNQMSRPPNGASLGRAGPAAGEQRFGRNGRTGPRVVLPWCLLCYTGVRSGPECHLGTLHC